MALQEALLSITIEAGADLSAEQFTFMQVASDGQADQAGAGETAIGVLQNDPDAAGKAATIAIVGVSKVVAGATVAAGARIMSDATGRGITATATNHIVGTAITGGAVNTIISVLLGTNNVL